VAGENRPRSDVALLHGLVHFQLVSERRERPRTLAVEEHQALVGVIELALGGSVFAVSVTLPFAEAEQRQANGPALRFFLAEVDWPGRSDSLQEPSRRSGGDDRRRDFPYLSPNRESRTAAPNAAYPAPVHLYPIPLIYSSTHLHDCADEMIGRAIMPALDPRSEPSPLIG
jgi:hypothetical protein